VLLPSVARFGAPVPRCRKVRDPQGQLREVLRPRASCRPDDPFCSLPQPPGDLDRVAAKHKPGDLEEQLVLGRPDLRLDDLDGQVFLLAADQAGDTGTSSSQRAREDPCAASEQTFRLRASVSEEIRSRSLNEGSTGIGPNTHWCD